MKARSWLVPLLGAVALAGCSSMGAGNDPAASPAFTPQTDCERNGGWWHPDMSYCEYQAPPPPRFPAR